MLRSNVIDYAAIAMAESRNSGIFDQDYLAGITVLGFNELVENGFITIDGNCKIHCNEITDMVPEYLKPLEEAIRKEETEPTACQVSSFTAEPGETPSVLTQPRVSRRLLPLRVGL